jgi:hypothetical protein
MADMATGTVKHGGRYYGPGELIKGLKAAERKELLAAGAIEVVGGQQVTAQVGNQKDADGNDGADAGDGDGGEGGEE